MIIVGLILLLPGLCTAILGVMLVSDEGLRVLADGSVWAIAIPCLAISAGGIALITGAIKKR